MYSSPIDTSPPRGLDAFRSLRAEDEPWLSQCYIEPTDFELMASWRSALIFGDAGSGKTALLLALERKWCSPGEKSSVLLVRWPLAVFAAPGPEGTRLVLEQTSQVLDLVARKLVGHLGCYPNDWDLAPSWAQNTLIWFVQRHLRGDIVHFVTSLEKEIPVEGRDLLRHLTTASAPDILYEGTPVSLVIVELVKALQTIGLEGVRITVDGLEAWIRTGQEFLIGRLEQFLSTLGLFEHHRLAYTMLLPSELESPLWSAGGVVCRRADPYSLRWDAETLRTIVERRLALAQGKIDFTLDRLTAVKPLLNWLARCGGTSPTGWLQVASHFFAAYLAQAEQQGNREPLTAKERLAVQEQHPPRLRIDLETGQVSVGWRKSIDLQRGQQALLRYLYERRGQTCLRRDLYRAYLEGTDRQLPAQVFEKDFAGPLDNAIYRLRRSVEPDPAHPVLIVTVTGEGFRLDNAW